MPAPSSTLADVAPLASLSRVLPMMDPFGSAGWRGWSTPAQSGRRLVQAVDQWADLGATKRVAAHSLLTDAVVVWDRPAIGAASATSAPPTALGRPTLGGHSQTTPPPTRQVRASPQSSTR